MSKFPVWFPTYAEVNAFLASKSQDRSFSTDGIIEHDRRHRRITWASYQALAWAKANTVTDKATILRKIQEILSPPVNYAALMASHPTCRSTTRPQFRMTNGGVKKLG